LAPADRPETRPDNSLITNGALTPDHLRKPQIRRLFANEDDRCRRYLLGNLCFQCITLIVASLLLLTYADLLVVFKVLFAGIVLYWLLCYTILSLHKGHLAGVALMAIKWGYFAILAVTIGVDALLSILEIDLF